MLFKGWDAMRKAYQVADIGPPFHSTASSLRRSGGRTGRLFCQAHVNTWKKYAQFVSERRFCQFGWILSLNAAVSSPLVYIFDSKSEVNVCLEQLIESCFHNCRRHYRRRCEYSGVTVGESCFACN